MGWSLHGGSLTVRPPLTGPELQRQQERGESETTDYRERERESKSYGVGE